MSETVTLPRRVVELALGRLESYCWCGSPSFGGPYGSCGAHAAAKPLRAALAAQPAPEPDAETATRLLDKVLAYDAGTGEPQDRVVVVSESWWQAARRIVDKVAGQWKAVKAETAAGVGSSKASTDPEDMASDINEMAAELDSRCGCEFPRDYHDPRIEPLKECTYHGAIRASLTAAQARIAELEAGLRHWAGYAVGHSPARCHKCEEAAALLGEGEKP